ncbi:hypothetical protein RUND412_007831 [Rhizina undulata]
MLWENEYLDMIETCPSVEFMELRRIMIAHRSPFWWLQKVVRLERLRRIEISIVEWDTVSLTDWKMSRPHKVLNSDKVALDDIALHGGLSDGGWSRILGPARRMERNP